MRSLLLAALLCPTLAFTQSPPPVATPAEELKVADGFKVELLRSATKEEGSWVCMAVDAKGRLYISPQGAVPESGWKKENAWGGLWRVTLDAQGKIAAWEKVPVPVGDAMGMLWAFDSLYVSGSGPEGRAIYRLKDTNGDDALDAWTLFKKVPGGNGEHGAHALVLGPDGKGIYIVHGNSTPLVEGTDPKSPYRNYAEDDLLPRVMDPVATFFDKIKSPYGYVLKTDENGEKWDLVAGGFRNPYDIDFNADGQLFTYDSDMEWDVGSPWYRPTRVLHVVPGGEYGFREGTSKWPSYYADSLPAAVDIGLGCPTGVKFGTRSNFPENYKKAFFILDWTFGRILAVHLKPKGASYVAENPLPSAYNLTGPASSPDVEEFVRGKGLPVTDVEFGNDGAMYFTIGGRGTQAGLYRVSWAGKEVGGAAPEDFDMSQRGQRALRQVLEKTEITEPSAPTAKVVGTVLRQSGSRDPFIRFAARRFLEASPIDRWRSSVLSEQSPQAALTGLLALARVGTKDDQEPLLNALGKVPLAEASDEIKLDALRVLEVSFARQGRPSTDAVEDISKRLAQSYPAQSFALNRELCALLVYLGAPDVVEKSLALIDKTEEPAEQIWYALCLREATNWTPAQREKYFKWFAKARTFRGGNSFGKFILRIRDQALEKLPEAERPGGIL